MHIQKLIEQFGLSPTQAKAYLVMLSLGEATISEIAKKSQLPRTSLYFMLEVLNKNGLANFYKKKRRKYWVAENPDKFMLILKENEASLKELMPSLQAIRHESGAKPSIRFYEGVDGIKLILKDVLNEKRHFLAMTSVENAEALLGESFQDFIEQRFKRNLKVRFLTNYSTQTLGMKKRDSEELRDTRFLPKKFILKNASFIYGIKVAILSLSKKQSVGIIIEDPDIAATQSMLFEAMWEQCEP